MSLSYFFFLSHMNHKLVRERQDTIQHYTKVRVYDKHLYCFQCWIYLLAWQVKDKVYNIFDTVIGLSYICCHYALYSLNNPSLISLAQLHSISELQNFKHSSSPLALLKLELKLKHSSTFLYSWGWRIGRGLTSGLTYGLSLLQSENFYMLL